MAGSGCASGLDRRTVLNRTIASLGIMPSLLVGRRAAGQSDPWTYADQIVSSIHLPTIPDRSFVVTGYGAVGDGRKDCTASIRQAIVAARDAGGGHVIVPPGRFLTGAIELYDRIDLHLERNATLIFKTNPAAYLPVVATRFAGQDCLNYRPLVRAYGRRNVAITGSGTIDGQADNAHWWPWRGKAEFGWVSGQPNEFPARRRLREQGATGVPLAQRVYGDGSYLRPSLIQPYGCTRILIEGVTLRNAPWWMIHSLFSTSVTIKNVVFESLGPNNDGCDLECSQQVLVEGCTFQQRDDKVVIKSGYGRDGIVGTPGLAYGPRPTQDVVMRHCRVGGYGVALAVGSEVGGGAERIFAYDVTNGSGDGSLGHACLIKSSTYRGGTVQGVWLKDFRVAACELEAIRLTYTYDKDDLAGPYRPRFENVKLEGIVCGRSLQALNAMGQPGLPMVGLHLKDCRFDVAEKLVSRVQNVDDFTAKNVTVAGAPAQFR